MKEFLDKCKFCVCGYYEGNYTVTLDQDSALWFDSDDTIDDVKNGHRQCDILYLGQCQQSIFDFILRTSGKTYIGKIMS